MILHQYVEEKISTNFNILCNFNGRKIDVVSMCFLRRILNRQKIDFSSTCFLWRNFDGQKIDILLTYFIPRNFAGQKIDIVSMYFIRRYFDEPKIDVVLTYLFRHNVDGPKSRCYFDVFFKQFSWKTDSISRNWFWFVSGRQTVGVILTSLFEKLLIYQKIKLFELHFWT